MSVQCAFFAVSCACVSRKTGLLKSKLNSAIVVGAMNQDPKMRRIKPTLGGDETVYRYRLGVV